MEEFLKELQLWEDSFSCTECDNSNRCNFIYDTTYANGETWICKKCGTVVMVEEEPNNDE